MSHHTSVDINEHILSRTNVRQVISVQDLDGPGIESRWGEICSTRPYRSWGPPSLLCCGYLVSCPGVKKPGSGVNHPSASSAEVKESVELYFTFPLGPHCLFEDEMYIILHGSIFYLITPPSCTRELVITFFGAFAEFRKATISFVLSVCPYGTTDRILMKLGI